MNPHLKGIEFYQPIAAQMSLENKTLINDTTDGMGFLSRRGVGEGENKDKRGEECGVKG